METRRIGKWRPEQVTGGVMETRPVDKQRPAPGAGSLAESWRHTESIRIHLLRNIAINQGLTDPKSFLRTKFRSAA
jgi:hypothetical protein